MSNTPNRRLHEDGGNASGSASGSGNHSHPSVLKYSHDDQGTYSSIGGKAAASSRHDYHTPYDIGQEGWIPKIVPRNESRDADRRSPLLPPNMLFRVSTPNDSHSDHAGSETRMEFRDSKDSNKEIKVENRDMKSESRELQQNAKFDKYDNRADDNKDVKLERDSYSELKGNEKLDKDGYNVSNIQLNWKDMKEQHRVKQYPDIPGGNADTWHTSRTGLHGPVDAPKEGLHVDNRDFAEAHETVAENKVDAKGDDRVKDKDRKRKEVKHWDWGERDKERSDRRNNFQSGNSNSENKEVIREERESERWGNEKKDPLKEKEKVNEKEKDHVKREVWNGSDKDASHNEKELVDIPAKSVEQESSTLEAKKKDHDTWKNVEREARDKKKERDADVEPEKPDKRSRYNEKESDEGGMHAEGGTEREREVLNSGLQQRKRMLRPRGSPQMGNRDPRSRPSANDNEGYVSFFSISLTA